MFQRRRQLLAVLEYAVLELTRSSTKAIQSVRSTNSVCACVIMAIEVGP